MTMIWLMLTWMHVISDLEPNSKMLVSSTRVIERGDVLHESYRLEEQFAAYYGTLQQRERVFNPAKIMIPETEQDVMQIVKHAREQKAQIVVKSGGHSYTGTSSCNADNCWQIDMKHFDRTDLVQDEESGQVTSIIVGAGQKLGALYNILASSGLGVAILGGNCAGVGAGGHYQSSSVGAYTRSLGTGFDYIRNITLIDAKGQKRTVGKGTDLYWAVLGGSPGSWGIVLQYEFEPVYDDDYPNAHLYRRRFVYNRDTLRALTEEYFRVLNHELLKDSQDIGMIYLASAPVLMNTSDASTHVVNLLLLVVTWTGINSGSVFDNIVKNGVDQGTTWYQELLAGFDAIPANMPGSVTNKSMSISATLNSGASPEDLLPTPPYRYYLQHSTFDTDMFEELMRDEKAFQAWLNGIVDKVDSLAAPDYRETDVDIFFQLWNFFIPSGADAVVRGETMYANDPRNNKNAYPLRNIAFEFNNWILFGNHENGDKAAARAWAKRQELDDWISINGTFEKIKTMAFPEDYYEDLDVQRDWKQYFHGPKNAAVYQKLRGIKTEVDDGNLFNGPLTIKPRIKPRIINQ